MSRVSSSTAKRPEVLELRHPGGDPLRVAGEVVEQPLEVGRDEDVHGRRGRLDQRAGGDVVDPAREEVEEHVVAVAGAEQAADGHAHVLGVPGGEDVAEVAGGHADVDALAVRHRAARGEVGVPARVVGDLRQQPAPVDGVGRAQREAVPLGQLGGEGRVVEHGLDRALAVVEVAAQAEDREVLAGLGDHLQFLQRRHPGVGVVDADPRVGAIGEAVERRHAGVTAGRHEDEEVQVRGALGVRLLRAPR